MGNRSLTQLPPISTDLTPSDTFSIIANYVCNVATGWRELFLPLGLVVHTSKDTSTITHFLGDFLLHTSRSNTKLVVKLVIVSLVLEAVIPSIPSTRTYILCKLSTNSGREMLQNVQQITNGVSFILNKSAACKKSQGECTSLRNFNTNSDQYSAVINLYTL